MKYFDVYPHVCDMTKYMVNPTDELCKIIGPLPGSYRVFTAHMFGLEYASFIYMLFSWYKDRIMMYSYLGGPAFSRREDAEDFAAKCDERFIKVYGR